MQRPRTVLTRAGRVAGCVGAAIVLVSGLAAQGLAQTVVLRGGTAISSVHLPANDEFGESTAFAPGLTVGGLFSVGLPWRFRIQGEGHFVLERAKTADVVESRFRYFDVPVMMTRVLPAVRVANRPLIVEAGGVYRRLISASDSFGGESFSITDGVRGDGVLYAVGAVMPLARRWSMDVRYLHGQHGIYRRVDGRFAGRWRSVQIAGRYALSE
jgi:hypothetical protein